ncbi:MAG: hypothetical protein JWL83_470 [Actinomycetia bacterium]|nr:hypothetical protein [Actinomycetes bacterium]
MNEIALVGPFDTPSLSVQLARRVIEAEMRDRNPGVRVRAFAPTAGAPGIDPVEAFAPVDAGRRAAFAAAFPHIVVVGDPAVGADLIDPAARVTRIEGELALLAPRWYSPNLLAQRREFLVAMEWWPRTATGRVVQGDVDADVDGDVAAVRVDAEPGDDAVGWNGPRISLGAGACLDDVVTVIAIANTVAARAPSVLALAEAFRGDVAPDVLHALDDQLDVLSRAVTGDAPQRFAATEIDALQRALDGRGRRLAAERTAMADRVWEIERRLEGELAARDAQIAALESERDALRARIEVRARAALGRVARSWREGGVARRWRERGIARSWRER